MNGDLYLGSPISSLAGDKLYECAKAVRLEKIIDELKAEVAFPDIRALVNTGVLPFSEVLQCRKRSGNFRRWLQDESERDRSALVAYHDEFGQNSGLARAGRKALQLFGIFFAGSAAQAITSSLDASLSNADPISKVTFTAGGAGAAALLAYAFQIGTAFREWKPVVFGKWLSDRIKRIEET
jgi:hypothetical protein